MKSEVVYGSGWRRPSVRRSGAATVLLPPFGERLAFGFLFPVIFVPLVAVALAVRNNSTGALLAIVGYSVSAAVLYRGVFHPRVEVRDGIVTVRNPVRRVSFEIDALKKIKVGLFRRRWFEREIGPVLYFQLRDGTEHRVYASQGAGTTRDLHRLAQALIVASRPVS